MTTRSVPRPATVGGSAEILFFMGVRYHRMSDDEFEQAMARRPAPVEPAKPTHAKTKRSSRKRA